MMGSPAADGRVVGCRDSEAARGHDAESPAALPPAQRPRGAAGAGLPARKEEDAALALRKMEMGWPTDVRHVAHITLDLFHGFLGLPVEFKDEMPCRVPSASYVLGSAQCQSNSCIKQNFCGITAMNLICSGNASLWKS